MLNYDEYSGYYCRNNPNPDKRDYRSYWIFHSSFCLNLFFMIKNNHTLLKIIIFSGSLKKSINAFCAAGIKQSTFL
jgi:hypothetical protein